MENVKVAPPFVLDKAETTEVDETAKSEANAAVLPERPDTTIVHVIAELIRCGEATKQVNCEAVDGVP